MAIEHDIRKAMILASDIFQDEPGTDEEIEILQSIPSLGRDRVECIDARMPTLFDELYDAEMSLQVKLLVLACARGIGLPVPSLEVGVVSAMHRAIGLRAEYLASDEGELELEAV